MIWYITVTSNHKSFVIITKSHKAHPLESALRLANHIRSYLIKQAEDFTVLLMLQRLYHLIIVHLENYFISNKFDLVQGSDAYLSIFN